jgi:inositol 1,4,5-triphosphate receptor type 1/inositol 1,4,5-triphosphate receptor type 3
MLLSIVINFLIFSSLYRTTDDEREVTEYSEDFKFDYGFLYKKKNIQDTKKILNILSLLQFLFALLIFINYILKNIAKFSYYEKNDRKENEVSYLKRGLKFLKNMYDDYSFLYHLIYLIFAILGFATKNYKYFSFLLVEIIPRSLTLMFIVKSFWIPRKQLIVTLFLFYLFCYYFVIFIYLYMADQLPTKDCYRFDDCYFTICDQAFKNSNGVINWLDENYLLVTDLMFKNSRFWLDNLFAIINIILVFQMVGGIIIDNFSALRQSQGETDEDRDNICFICGLHRTELNKLYGNEDGYTEHIKIDHYFWNYMFLIFNLMKKDPKTLMGIDEFIFTNFNENQSTSWIPLGTCRKKIDFENKDNGDEKEKEDDE